LWLQALWCLVYAFDGILYLNELAGVFILSLSFIDMVIHLLHVLQKLSTCAQAFAHIDLKEILVYKRELVTFSSLV